MATVETVLGPIDGSQLGFTLAHEHVTSSVGEHVHHYPWMFDHKQMMERAIAVLKEAKAGGVDSVIDHTTPDIGRDVEFYAEASRVSGVHVVVATGMHNDVPRPFWTMDIDKIADIFVHEIEEGIGNTSIKAGIIKLAHDTGGLNDHQRRVARAAGRASKRTGCPVSTHHWPSERTGLEQIQLLQEEGASMDRVSIGHSGDTTDVDYLEEMLKQGVYLTLDRYPGQPPRPTWEQRNATVKALIDRGWADKLMIGHDYVAAWPVGIPGWESPSPQINPDWFLFISRVAIPGLLEDGVPQETIDLMMRETPRKFLTGEA